MRIGALTFGRTNVRRSFHLSWHSRKSITWRWSAHATVDRARTRGVKLGPYFFRNIGGILCGLNIPFLVITLQTQSTILREEVGGRPSFRDGRSFDVSRRS